MSEVEGKGMKPDKELFPGKTYGGILTAEELNRYVMEIFNYERDDGIKEMLVRDGKAVGHITRGGEFHFYGVTMGDIYIWREILEFKRKEISRLKEHVSKICREAEKDLLRRLGEGFMGWVGDDDES